MSSNESQKSKHEVLSILANCSQIWAVLQSLSSQELQLVVSCHCDDERVHYYDTFHLGQVHSTAGVLPMSEFRPKYRDRLSFSSLSASTDAKLIEAGLAVTNLAQTTPLSSSLTDLRPGLKQQSEKSQTTLSVGRQRPGERGGGEEVMMVRSQRYNFII